ncbi:MarR family winged helix-turn-helix transcriptional regulator [Streptomyces sp. NPDC006487]|uniref:MarR family winged helix-turn-helix transcriptional regulator n=1 Tax=Streptomyces sp. NPDC006487 TaxID=3364748 RepID=UPI0036B6149C
MPRALPSHVEEQGALDTCAVAELLEVLWSSNQETAVGPVPPSQLRALTVIEQRAGINLRDLGEALGSAPPAVSRLCDRLEAAGLLQRSRGRINRREVELTLSRRGSAVLAETRALRAHKAAEVLRRMSSQDRHALAQGLAAFRDAATTHIRLGAFPDRDEPLPDTG